MLGRPVVGPRPQTYVLLILGGMICMSSCVRTPLRPVNRSPVVQSLVAFPTNISPGDSAVVVCHATDPDGDPVEFDWTSDCRLIKQGAFPWEYTAHSRGNTMVVYGGACADAPVDTGWIACDVRDGKGGGARAGVVLIVIRQ